LASRAGQRKTLPTLTCPSCHRKIVSVAFSSNAKGGAPHASTYASCLRRCEDCGRGFSNAATSHVARLTELYRDPFLNLPASIADGHAAALAQALNVLNRPSKRAKFVSANSEDHVTWTLFRHLQAEGRLRTFLSCMGIDFATPQSAEPILLLWGVPIPPSAPGRQVRSDLIGVLNDLKERHERRSEPDVILDCGSRGIVFIEVKLRSPNESKADYEGWQKYLKDTDAFSESAQAKRSGLYELARNWRIAWDMAKHRPMALVNLGPPNLFTGKYAAPLKGFTRSLQLTPKRQFRTVGWESLWGALPNHPEWLRRYAEARRVPIS